MHFPHWLTIDQGRRSAETERRGFRLIAHGLPVRSDQGTAGRARSGVRDGRGASRRKVAPLFVFLGELSAVLRFG